MRPPIVFCLFITSLLFLGTLAFAHEEENVSEIHAFLDTAFTSEGTLTPELQGQLAMATTQFQQLPAPVQSLFGNQRVNLEVTLADGTKETVGVVLANNQVLDVQKHALDHATLSVQTDEVTIARITSQENVGSALLDSVSGGKIRYQGLDAGTTITTGIAGILLWITALLANIGHAIGLN